MYSIYNLISDAFSILGQYIYIIDDFLQLFLLKIDESRSPINLEIIKKNNYSNYID